MNKIINWFKNLLKQNKHETFCPDIDSSAVRSDGVCQTCGESITEPDPILTIELLRSIEGHLALIASSVKVNHHGNGDQYSISTKHWND